MTIQTDTPIVSMLKKPKHQNNFLSKQTTPIKRMKEIRKTKAQIKQSKLRKQKNPTAMERFAANYVIPLQAWSFAKLASR